MTQHDYIEDTPAQRLRNWILSEMMRGAGYAAAVLVGVGALVGLIWVVGQFLPEDSKNAPPPMPYSALAAPALTAKA